MKYFKLWKISSILVFVLLLSGCADTSTDTTNSFSAEFTESIEESISESSVVSSSPTIELQESISKEESPEQYEEPLDTTSLPTFNFSLSDVPTYSENSYVVINDKIPYFSDNELTTQSFELYSKLDELGRCGVAYASIGTDLIPTEERGEIVNIKPTSWHTVKYNDIVDGNYLYNRCHLIGFQLSGENDNEKNLITGTRYLNIQGMLPFENMVADYVKEINNHVLYRVTPIFEEDNLLAAGVLIEAKSVEDVGDGILFCVFIYNVQPNIIINYASGESELAPSTQTPSPTIELTPEPTVDPTPEPTVEPEIPIIEEPIQGDTTYILNTNTKKFHYPTCSSVGQMKEKNKSEYTGTRDEIISMGYDPCKRCNP